MDDSIDAPPPRKKLPNGTELQEPAEFWSYIEDLMNLAIAYERAHKRVATGADKDLFSPKEKDGAAIVLVRTVSKTVVTWRSKNKETKFPRQRRASLLKPLQKAYRTIWLGKYGIEKQGIRYGHEVAIELLIDALRIASKKEVVEHFLLTPQAIKEGGGAHRVAAEKLGSWKRLKDFGMKSISPEEFMKDRRLIKDTGSDFFGEKSRIKKVKRAVRQVRKKAQPK